MKVRFHLRTMLITAAALLMVSACAAQVPKPPQVVDAEEISYEKWGFRVSVPKGAKKYVIADEPDAELSEMYVSDGLGYIVRVTRVSENALPATAVEQAIQADMQAGAALGPTKRWEIYSMKRQLFKGLNRTIKFDEPALSKAPFLRELVGGDTGFRSLGMAPLRDDPNAIVSVGVLGPPGRAEDIENYAKFAVFNVARTARRPGSPGQNGTSAVRPPRPDGGRVRPGAKPLAPDGEVRPAPVEMPTPAKPRIRPGLKKGDIELVGPVDKMEPARKRLTMIVDQITLPGGDPIKLDPPRSKTVLLRRMPKEVSVGTRIVVIGRNDGVGTPIRADFLDVAPPLLPPALPPPPPPPADPES